MYNNTIHRKKSKTHKTHKKYIATHNKHVSVESVVTELGV